MATSTGSKSNSNRQQTNRNGNKKSNQKKYQSNPEVKSEIILIALFALAILLFLCNFNIIGTFGRVVKNVMFGMFGLLAYIISIVTFLMISYTMINKGSFFAMKKIIAIIVLLLCLSIVFQLMSFDFNQMTGNLIKWLYDNSSKECKGGGVIGGLFAYGLYKYLAMAGTLIVVFVLSIISLVVITEKTLLKGMRQGSRKVYESAKEEARLRKEQQLLRQEELSKDEEESGEELQQQKKLRKDKKVAGVILNTQIDQADKKEVKQNNSLLGGDNLHEIKINFHDEAEEEDEWIEPVKAAVDYFEVEALPEPKGEFIQNEPFEQKKSSDIKEMKELTQPNQPTPIIQPIQSVKLKPKKYIFPSLQLLSKGVTKGNNNSAKQLKETALQLQQTLLNFGVKVMITDISQGPSVTRYEMQPEQGVKVSKIVSLVDDIKLNLAATDIRIEAPIPGKAAVGIEVPNKENSAVALRDLLETKIFKEFPSNIAFAVGKDISGQTIVADIAKMPHMLIAGATGSGKSVCINTLIMSILYKANPDDVKLIMIDPKVVELSVYNGIPHLLIPVVTDPKKAAGALHWGVAEMTERYKKFADFNVRDLKGYNKKIEELKKTNSSDTDVKMPQIIIIVDELADLMMVAPGEVEESICRLAQLARAAGIHLIIATQRPSVDVITGLIKANMPSRVAFSVSSGVDSRTILDMNGAEKLLGKGDMLFYPQGYTKPARVQGAFVSDNEVSDVVDFLKNQAIGNVYCEEVEQKISSIGSGSNAAGGFDSASELDAYFVDAGRFIIEKDKASIGMLQRVFKIGFNRAARIMDQLCDAGVVGEEEGTKPRKVLMTELEFEQYVEEM